MSIENNGRNNSGQVIDKDHFTQVLARGSQSALKQMVEPLSSVTPGAIRTLQKNTPKKQGTMPTVFTTGSRELFSPDKKSALTTPDHYGVISRRSNIESSSNLSHSHSGVRLVQNRFEIVARKQERDLERWKRQLAIQEEQTNYSITKDKQIKHTLETKSAQVLDLQKQRAMHFKQKNDMALARARDNENRLLA